MTTWDNYKQLEARFRLLCIYSCLLGPFIYALAVINNPTTHWATVYVAGAMGSSAAFLMFLTRLPKYAYFSVFSVMNATTFSGMTNILNGGNPALLTASLAVSIMLTTAFIGSLIYLNHKVEQAQHAGSCHDPQ